MKLYRLLNGLNAFIRGSNVARPKCTISRNESQNKFLLRIFALFWHKEVDNFWRSKKRRRDRIMTLESVKGTFKLTMVWRITQLSEPPKYLS